MFFKIIQNALAQEKVVSGVVKDANGKVKATVTLTKMVDGKETIEEKVFEGDDLEVEAKIAELGK